METGRAMHAQANAAVSTTLCRALIASGVGHVVVSPGSRNTPLVLALAACDSVRPHVVIDERVGGFLALGLARASGEAALLVCTSGSAGAHYLPAVIEASEWGVPLIVLTADRPAELHHVGAPQTTVQRSLFDAHVRWHCSLEVPGGDIPSRWLGAVAARALDYAEGAVPGPVHLNIPFREPLWEPTANYRTGAEQQPAAVLRGTATLDEPGYEMLAGRLRHWDRGVILCGPRSPEHAVDGVDRLAEAVSRLGAHLGWPVIGDGCSQLRFGPHDRRAVIVAADALVRDPGFAGSHAPNGFLRIGRIPTSKPVRQWCSRHGENRTVLVDATAAWHDPDCVADLLCVADPTAFCEALLRKLPPARDTSWLDAWRRADEVALEALGAACQRGLWEGAIAWAVSRALPDGAMLHVGSSMPVRDLDSFAPHRRARIAVFANRGVNGIDGTLSTAFGEGSAWRRGPVAVLIGDLAFLHDLGGLRAAVRAGARGTVVLVNNDGGGIFDYLPIAAHDAAFDEYFRTPQHADIGSLCVACGARHKRIASLRELQGAIAESLVSPSIDVLEVVIDHRDSHAAHERAWRSVADRVVSHRMGELP